MGKYVFEKKLKRLEELRGQLQIILDKPVIRYSDVLQKETIEEKIKWLERETAADKELKGSDRAAFLATVFVGFILGIIAGAGSMILIFKIF